MNGTNELARRRPFCGALSYVIRGRLLLARLLLVQLAKIRMTMTNWRHSRQPVDTAERETLRTSASKISVTFHRARGRRLRSAGQCKQAASGKISLSALAKLATNSALYCQPPPVARFRFTDRAARARRNWKDANHANCSPSASAAGRPMQQHTRFEQLSLGLSETWSARDGSRRTSGALYCGRQRKTDQWPAPPALVRSQARPFNTRPVT